MQQCAILAYKNATVETCSNASAAMHYVFTGVLLLKQRCALFLCRRAQSSLDPIQIICFTDIVEQLQVSARHKQVMMAQERAK